MNFHDAHNHLQDPRLAGRHEACIAAAMADGVAGMVVNGTGDRDWADVLTLARQYPDLVHPAFGCHPWFVHTLPANWECQLERLLDSQRATLGEIGLDRWKPDLPWDGQEAVFRRQLRLAHRRNIAVSIHCLRAWGPLVACLESEPLPARGFLLHSFGGSLDIAQRLIPLGAHFSISGHLAHPHRQHQRDIIKALPIERLLVETDAPDQLPPGALITHPLVDSAGTPINHPANLISVYHFTANLLEQPLATIATQVAQNFDRLFAS